MGVFRHFFTGGRTVFSTPHALKVVGDAYPSKESEVSNALIPTVEQHDGENNSEGILDGKTFALIVEQAKAEK